MAIENLNLTKNEVSQDIDLEEIVGREVPTAIAVAIGQEIIDRIIERTEDGKANNNRSFPAAKNNAKGSKYSESYVDSLEFKAFGKSKNPINMTLSGGMLESIDILEVEGGRLKIGIDDDVEAAKAYGHMTGMEGHPTLQGKVKPRQFFGVTYSEIRDIVSRYDIPEEEPQTAADIFEAIDFFQSVASIFGRENG